jgi:uncharacterized membrane protein (UPF0182 family)
MKRTSWLLIALVLFMVVAIRTATGLFIDLLWFENLGFREILITVLASSWTVQFAAWLYFAVFLYFNLALTQKALSEMPNLVMRQMLMNSQFGNLLAKNRLRVVFLLTSLVLPWLFTAGLGNNWLAVRLALAGGEAGLADPVFARDAAFYLFQLPVLEILYQYLMMVSITTILLCGAIYLFIQPPEQLGLRTLFAKRGQVHLSVLVALAFLIRAFGYRLQMYSLLLSPRGATFGAGYTDLHAQLPAYSILFFLSVLAAIALLFNIKVKSARLITGSIVALVAASVVLGAMLPGAVQAFLVEPNEFAREEPYLEHNIRFTQIAYGLDKIKTEQFPLTGTLEYGELLADTETLENIRLWDWRPLQQTYTQLQGLRRYYRFHDVDTDRYFIDGQYRQLMLSARELVAEDLPSRTWVNERLAYTHGYGLVASPVNEVTGQGQPRLAIRDLPVESETDLQVDVPQIYYGELTDNYIFTNTKTDEFDYPMGDTNAFYRYNGEGGIQLGGMLRRLLFALRFGDYRLLISGELTPQSRAHFIRTIDSRVRKIAPFLQYDEDPYLVTAEGRLFWIIDAYTTSSRFPYAEPYGGINYIRNSVKVVVDAYHGTVNFYIFDKDDPLVTAYAKIFPTLFTAAEEMPESLRQHVRYPEQLFKIQSQVFATYHMNNTQVFYNKEDQWQWPQEKYAGTNIVMEPYYTIARLPGEEDGEFVLMLPYTPITRDNMVAWLAGRSDGDRYGELVVFQFPKGELLYGPAQIEARIDQDSRISEQLTLWDQRGSSVIRGNLLVLPVNGSILYVEPIYLQSEQGQLPELARVIVAYGENVVMERTLEEALAAVFGLKPGTQPEPEPEQPPLFPGDSDDAGLHQQIQRATELYNAAQEALRRGDWAEYGQLQQELGSVLSRLQELGQETAPQPQPEE